MVLPNTNTDAVPTPEKSPAAPTTSTTPIAPDTKSGSVLPTTLLSQEDKSQSSMAKEALAQQVDMAKKAVVIFLLISIAWAGWIQMNVSESNGILSLVGVQMNSGQEAYQLKKEANKAKTEKVALEKKIKKLTGKIEDKNYTLYSEEIRDVREGQIKWFDTTNADGTIDFGISDAVPRMEEYFNSRTYTDPEAILSGIHGDIHISNLEVSRENITFTIDSSQILGKVFYLNIEFIEMINSFPFLKNAEIEQFARQKNDTDDDSMKFSVRLERQLADEEDPSDSRFEEYLNWLNLASMSN